MSKKNEDNENTQRKKIDEIIGHAWQELSLDVPKRVNPDPQCSQGLRRLVIIAIFTLALCKLIFGLVYFNECPTNDWLPIYLVVSGIIQFAFFAVLVIRELRTALLLTIFGSISITWNFISSVNIFVEWEPDYFKGGVRYCNEHFFYFTFFSCILDYLILIMMSCYSCIKFSFTTPEQKV